MPRLAHISCERRQRIPSETHSLGYSRKKKCVTRITTAVSTAPVMYTSVYLFTLQNAHSDASRAVTGAGAGAWLHASVMKGLMAAPCAG